MQKANDDETYRNTNAKANGDEIVVTQDTWTKDWGLTWSEHCLFVVSKIKKPTLLSIALCLFLLSQANALNTLNISKNSRSILLRYVFENPKPLKIPKSNPYPVQLCDVRCPPHWCILRSFVKYKLT